MTERQPSSLLYHICFLVLLPSTSTLPWINHSLLSRFLTKCLAIFCAVNYICLGFETKSVTLDSTNEVFGLYIYDGDDDGACNALSSNAALWNTASEMKAWIFHRQENEFNFDAVFLQHSPAVCHVGTSIPSKYTAFACRANRSTVNQQEWILLAGVLGILGRHSGIRKYFTYTMRWSEKAAHVRGPKVHHTRSVPQNACVEVRAELAILLGSGQKCNAIFKGKKINHRFIFSCL